MSFMAMLPILLKTFLGIETAFTKAGSLSVLNTTYLACSVALTCVLIDPLIKPPAIYVLRCSFTEANRLQTGENHLKVELSRARAASSGSVRAAQVFLIFFCLAGAVSAAPAEPAVSPSQLNESIDEVLKQPQFAWRMPREEYDSSAAPKSWIARVLHEGATAVVDAMKWVGRSIAAKPCAGFGRHFGKRGPIPEANRNRLWRPRLRMGRIIASSNDCPHRCHRIRPGGNGFPACGAIGSPLQLSSPKL